MSMPATSVAPRRSRDGDAHALQAHHEKEEQRGERGAHADPGRYARAVIESDARAQVVRSEGARHAEQDDDPGAG